MNVAPSIPLQKRKYRSKHFLESPTNIKGLLYFLVSKRPFSFSTWVTTLLFGLLYGIENQIILVGSGLNPTNIDIPLTVVVFGPEPMQGPPQVAYYMTFIGNSGFLQINLSGIGVTAVLSVLFGINMSTIVFITKRVPKTGKKSFASLLGALPSVLPSLFSASTCCSSVPLLLLFVGSVAMNSIGFMLRPYLSVFVYASLALLLSNIYYFGIKTLRARNSSFKLQACDTVKGSNE
jgi:hypothetical protein